MLQRSRAQMIAQRRGTDLCERYPHEESTADAHCAILTPLVVRHHEESQINTAYMHETERDLQSGQGPRGTRKRPECAREAR